jgi:hypothetical protein
MNLKQVVKENLEVIVEQTMWSACGDETLSYDISRQCVSEEDVERCLATLLEELSEQELVLIFQFYESDTYKRFESAMRDAYSDVAEEIKQVLYTMTETGGIA